MPSGGIKVNMRHQQGRDEYGRFISAVESGAEAAVMEMASLGANVSRSAAPVRTGRLRGAIHMFGGGLSGGWAVEGVPYAQYQEEGTGMKGRPGQWLTNHEDFYGIGPVGGTPATHFMRKGLEAVRERAQGILDAHMPF